MALTKREERIIRGAIDDLNRLVGDPERGTEQPSAADATDILNCAISNLERLLPKEKRA